MHDEDWIKSVFTVAEARPEPPSAMDPLRAMGDGRRRRRNRRVATTMAVAGITTVALVAVSTVLAGVNRGAPITAASASATPPVPTSCQPQQLPLPAGVNDGQVTGGDPTGRYLVGVAANDTKVMLWDNGQPHELLPPAGGAVIGLWVNSTGMVAGNSIEAKDKTTPWLYRDGKFTILTGHTSPYQLTGINSRGDVVATWQQLESSGPDDARPPLMWPAGSPERPQELLGGTGRMSAVGIDDDGTVVGTSSDFLKIPTTDEERHQALSSAPTRRIDPIYWSPDGVLHPLLIPSGLGPQAQPSKVIGGLVAGTVQSPAIPGQQVIIWHLPAGNATIVDQMWAVHSMNRHGWIAGHAGRFGGNAIYSGGAVRQLPLPTWADNDGSIFTTISDDGRIVGGNAGSSSATALRATLPFRWLCS